MHTGPSFHGTEFCWDRIFLGTSFLKTKFSWDLRQEFCYNPQPKQIVLLVKQSSRRNVAIQMGNPDPESVHAGNKSNFSPDQSEENETRLTSIVSLGSRRLRTRSLNPFRSRGKSRVNCKKRARTRSRSQRRVDEITDFVRKYRVGPE